MASVPLGKGLTRPATMATSKHLFKWQCSGINGRLRPCFAGGLLQFAASALFRRNPMKLYFVLVAPARAANVGAAARAMKTMGFDAMRLVGSRVHEEEEASWVAHGAQEILA